MDTNNIVSDAHEETANMRGGATLDSLTDSGLGIIEDDVNFGFYVGMLDDPESQEWHYMEENAYAALEEMQREYLINLNQGDF
jgi:hypothetical protein